MVLKRFLNGHEVTEGESQEMEEELANFAKKYTTKTARPMNCSLLTEQMTMFYRVMHELGKLGEHSRS